MIYFTSVCLASSHQPLRTSRMISTHTHPLNFFPRRTVPLLILLPRPPSASHMFFFRSSCFSQCFGDELEMRKQETHENAEKQTRKVYSSEFFIRCRCFFVIIRGEVGWEKQKRAPFHVFLSFKLRHITCVLENKKNSGFCGVSPNLLDIHLWDLLKSLSTIFFESFSSKL